MEQNEIIILGGGLTGLSAGYVLTNAGLRVKVFESDITVGGLSKTIVRGGFRFDLGGHRFFTKDEKINKFVKNLMDGELLCVSRKSKIYMRNRSFDYPLRPFNAMFGLGIATTMKILYDYGVERMRMLTHEPDNISLEDWVVSNFGRKMFDIYFKGYSEKVWGIECNRISAEWVEQRIRGLSLFKAIKSAFLRFNGKNLPTLAQAFLYPQLGIGRISERLKEEIEKKNNVFTNTDVKSIEHSGFEIKGITVKNNDSTYYVSGKNFISSIPITKLVKMLNPPPPDNVLRAVSRLRFRGIIVVAVMVNRRRVTDQTWIYVPEQNIPFGRVHEPTNWSEKMAPEDKSLVVVEFFSSVGDRIWNESDESLADIAVKNLEYLKFIRRHEVIDSVVVRAPHAYPLFEIGYKEIYDEIYDYLSVFKNLYVAGRGGMFRYYNMDHAIESGIDTAEKIFKKADSYQLKMRCALVIPSWVPEDIFSSKTAGSQINYWQPLGTLYVAASLLKAGHDVRFLNGAFLAHSEILGKLSEYKPEFVGIYSTAFGWKKALQTASEVKTTLRDAFITVGGPYPIAMQEQCLIDSESIDAVVTGEGELTVVEMLNMLSQGRGLKGVEGVIFRENGKIIKNPPRPLISDLDSLPFPARELLGDAKKYIPPPATYKRKPVAVIITSRGCNRRCLFCFQIDKERKSGIRYRSIENVMEEIELCLKQGYREIKFIDDTLAADYDRAMGLAKEIKSRRLDFTWYASVCVNQVDNPLLKAFKDAGCWAILFGAESGVQKNLNAIRKGITLDQTRKAVKAAKEAGLKVITPFIFGIPGETFEDGLMTIKFACELNPDIANFHALTPFPGTELYDNIALYGEMSGELTDFTYQGAAFIPHTMTRDEITQLRQIAFRTFYSRPSFILKKIIGLRNLHDMKAALRGLRSLFWLWIKKDLFKKHI